MWFRKKKQKVVIKRNCNRIKAMNIAIEINSAGKCKNLKEFVAEYRRLKVIEESYMELLKIGDTCF